MRKYIHYMIVAAILLVVALILLLNDRNGTLKARYESFSVKDTASVTSICIQKGTRVLVLTKKHRKWRVNRKYNANPYAIDRILGIISRIDIDSPVPGKMKQEILQKMKDSAMIVTISSEGDILKEYRLLDVKSLQDGSVIMSDRKGVPYIVDTEGFEGKLSVFFRTNPFEWRERTLFKYDPQDINSVEVEYPGNPQSSFIAKFPGENQTTIRSVATQKVSKMSNDWAMKYLMSFRMVPFHWIWSESVKSVNDSIKGLQPYCEIRVTDSDRQTDTVTFYRIPAQGKPDHFNPDMMYAKFQDDSIPVIVKYYDLDPIMQEYGDLVKP